MEVWLALITGIIIGWLVEWLIDWRYWRRGLEGLYQTQVDLRAALDRSEAEKAEALAASAALETQLNELRGRLETLSRTESGARRSLETALRENAQLKEQLTTTPDALRSALPAAAAQQHDPLGKIDGIGPVYEQMLLDAAIHTFAQLAAKSADELRAIIRPAAWQKIDFDGWLRDARNLAGQQTNVLGGPGGVG